MKKFAIVGLALTLALVGCGSHAQESQDQSSAEASQEEQTERLDPGVANSIITGDKWQYIYAGEDNPVMAAITNEMCKMATQRFEIKDGIFPAVEIIETAERDGLTEVYTLSEIDVYTLKDKVLKLSGSSVTPTRYDLKTASDGTYTVENYVEAEDGDGRSDFIKAMCHDDEELAKKMQGRLMHLQTRLGFIRDYTAAYALDVKGLIESDDTYVSIDTTEEPVDEAAEAEARAKVEREEAERKAAEEKAAQEKAEAEAKAAQEKAEAEKKAEEEAKAAKEKAEAEAKAAQEKAAAEAKAAAEEAERKKQAEEAAKQKQQEQESESHDEGENVTIDVQGSETDVYAQWHKDDDGKWWATFWTYNGTEIYADLLPDGSWLFYAVTDSGLRQVFHTDEESSVSGEYGPQGISSHWVDTSHTNWY